MFCSVNESNNMSLIDSNLYEYMNDNSNKEGKNLINKTRNIIEENFQTLKFDFKKVTLEHPFDVLKSAKDDKS